MFRSNLALKIVAILFAVILWSYVLSMVNPLRLKEIKDVSVALDMQTLKAGNLAISRDLSDIPDTVSIRVKVKQSEQKFLNNQTAKAYVDLSNISHPGIYHLTISANPGYGELIDVNPAEITLYVDQYVTRQVPVNVVKQGSVPAGYYADEPVINPGVINISGAKTDVQKVVNARCTVNLDGLKEGYSKSFEVELLDAAGNVVDPSLFSETLPTVIVNLNVLPVKEVEVDVEGSIIGQESLAAGYEIIGITCNPSKVRIVGEKSLLDGIDSIKLIPFTVAGSNTDIVTFPTFAMPEGIRILGADKAEVTVSIREITDQKPFKGVPVKIKNLSAGYEAVLDTSSVDVTVLAGISKLSKLLRSDIVPYVDLDGLTEGTYSLNIQFELPDGFVSENFSPSVLTVNVTIRRK